MPGGAACLASHFPTYREEEAAVEQLRFLVATHQLRCVVLVAHEDGGFYTPRLQVSSLQLETQQREDLKKAVRRVQSFGRHLQVDAFFARKHWDRIVLELWGSSDGAY